MATTELLKRDIQEISRGRTVGSAGHAEVQAYLENRLQQLDLQPYGDAFDLPYSVDGENFVNVVGVIGSEYPDRPPILIGAHYDSVLDAPCADDNAAAVAVALESARLLGSSPLERDVVIALFDAEEPPYYLSEAMGSLHFYHHQRDLRGFHAAIIMDLVGHDLYLPLKHLGAMGAMLRMFAKSTEPGYVAVPTVKDLLFATGAESHAALPGVFDAVGPIDGLGIVNTLNRYVGDLSDHHVFRENGVPYLFLSCGRWQHYHEPTDTPDRISYRKVTSVADLVTALVRQLASTDLPESGADADTTEFECRQLQTALGAMYGPALNALSLKPPQTRADLDAVAEALLACGL